MKILKILTRPPRRARDTYFVILLVGVLSFGFTAFAVEQAGQDIAVLKAGVGARPLGMGSAFTAIADNADAPYWNPAGLSQVKISELTTMQTKLSTDTDYYYVSYTRPFFKGALGVSWIQVGLGNILQTASPEGWPNEVRTLGVFTYFSNAYFISYGADLVKDKLAFGLTFKYLTSDMSTIAEGKATGFSLTPGVLYRPIKELSIGAKLDEVLNYQRWGTGTVEQAPAKLRLGLAYKIGSPVSGLWSTVLSADISQILRYGYTPEFCLGAEYNFADSIFFRAGYSDSTMSAGAGFRVKHAEVNYAYVTQTALSKENVHRISLSGRW